MENAVEDRIHEASIARSKAAKPNSSPRASACVSRRLRVPRTFFPQALSFDRHARAHSANRARFHPHIAPGHAVPTFTSHAAGKSRVPARRACPAQYLRAKAEHPPPPPPPPPPPLACSGPSVGFCRTVFAVVHIQNYDQFFQGLIRPNNAALGAVMRFPSFSIFASAPGAQGADADALKAKKEARPPRTRSPQNSYNFRRTVQQLIRRSRCAELELPIGPIATRSRHIRVHPRPHIPRPGRRRTQVRERPRPVSFDADLSTTAPGIGSSAPPEP